ncbi:preprotein translocase subunit SecE [Candidatus Uhrbacteria bacterium]|nr:preprotein translocase subunit SecE [Candidatus Uhrbacteria bacterium]
MNPLDYFRSAQAELKKVSWPSRKDTVRYSALVIAISLIVAVSFAALDQGFQIAVQGLLSRAPLAAPTAPITPTTEPISATPSQVDATTPSGAPANVTVTPVQ